MRFGGYRRIEDILIEKWYLTIPLAVIPFFIITNIGLYISARQADFAAYNQGSAVVNSNKSNQTPPSDKKSGPKSVQAAVDAQSSTRCSSGEPPTTDLTSATNLIIRKLTEYEKLCGGRVTDTLMVFTGMPTNDSSAKTNAIDMASTLKEFSKFKLQPLVVMEPTTPNGLIDFQQFSQGAYDTAFNTYFQTIKSQGVTDSMMGAWAPFPESNIPEWGSTNSSLFSANFVRAANIQKQHFPASKITIILDSLSYPPGVLDWDGGAYVSLIPYLQSIPKGLVDSFGYQGFTWASPANEPDFSNLDAAKFLKPDIAKEAAVILGTNHIWLNTGTHKTFYSTSPAKRTELTPAQRAQVLNGITTQAQWLQARGFKVTISLFAEDKTATGEDVDWSYWSGSTPTGPHADILKSFLAGLRSRSIGFWLFDNY
jgi:hypothetical protein